MAERQIPLLALSPRSPALHPVNDVSRMYDDVLEERRGSDDPWMIVEYRHGASGKWHSASVLPLPINRTWSEYRLPPIYVYAPMNHTAYFALIVGTYRSQLSFTWKVDVDDKDSQSALGLEGAARSVSVALKNERIFDRIAFSRHIAERLAASSFEDLEKQMKHRLTLKQNAAAALVASHPGFVSVLAWVAVSKAFERCGQALRDYRSPPQTSLA